MRGASHSFDRAAYLAGQPVPGVLRLGGQQLRRASLLDAVVEMSPAPLARATETRTVDPDEAEVLRLRVQDPGQHGPAHRDRIAFLRVCSGRFERGMK